MTDPPPLGAPYCHKRTTRAIAGRSPSHAVRSRRISRMRCPACRTENRPGVRFCEECGATLDVVCPACGAGVPTGKKFCGACGDRKSTRLNSSHSQISYAVFCLKKKKLAMTVL